ncbi:MAG: MBOAT family protein [Deltaproteobacteria bacterium]|nr:MBOAT family protein [Deltaproteobacteria bacterium]
MLFSSTVFLFLFLPLTLAGYYLIPVTKFRNTFLLTASLLFYAWGEMAYVLVMAASIVLNYIFGWGMEHLRDKKPWSKCFFIAALAINLGLLVTYKYANFLVENFNIGLQVWGLDPIDLAPVHLPLGISFFTFKAVTYVVDVYRRKVPFQKNPQQLALYISLFPYQVAGPIVRYQKLNRQLDDRSCSWADFSQGAERFIIGLGKKMILADSFGKQVDLIFSLPANQLPADTAWLGIVLYTLQLYFDFSGYSDMAIGLGKMFGFSFPENFNYPYVAASIREFWRRWHMTLSEWFREYLYIPLGGNRTSRPRVYFNLLLVFFLCGLWHGASWNFIIWGLFHGTFLILERLGLESLLAKLFRPLRHLYALLVIMSGWIFFRSETLIQALDYFRALLGFPGPEAVRNPAAGYLNVELIVLLVVGVAASTPFWTWKGFPAANRSGHRPLKNSALYEWGSGLLYPAFLGVILLACAMLLANKSYSPFIYFRF